MRTDNGLEFCNYEFLNNYNQIGINKHRTCSETSQQNRVAERMNIIILDKVRCLLRESGLSKGFWAKTVATTCHLINSSPSSTINFKTPGNLWTGKPPKLDHLKHFGFIRRKGSWTLEPRRLFF